MCGEEGGAVGVDVALMEEGGREGERELVGAGAGEGDVRQGCLRGEVLMYKKIEQSVGNK